MRHPAMARMRRRRWRRSRGEPRPRGEEKTQREELPAPLPEPKEEDPSWRILKAALALFTEKGYFNTSIAEIREAAGVSTGTIYHHFKTKEAIAKALLATILKSLEESLEEIWNHTPSVLDRLRKVTELLFSLAEETPQVLRFLLLLRHQEFIKEAPPLFLTPPFRKLRETLAEGIERGELRRLDPDIALACFLGPLFQTIRLRLEGVLAKPLEWCLLDTWSSIFKALSPPPEKIATP